MLHIRAYRPATRVTDMQHAAPTAERSRTPHRSAVFLFRTGGAGGRVRGTHRRSTQGGRGAGPAPSREEDAAAPDGPVETVAALGPSWLDSLCVRDSALELRRRPCQAPGPGPAAVAGAGEGAAALGAGTRTGAPRWTDSRSANGSVVRCGNIQANCPSVGS